MKKSPMQTDSYTPGDRVRVTVSGWTGTVVRKNKNRNNGYLVRWDEESRSRNQFAHEESWESPMGMEPCE